MVLKCSASMAKCWQSHFLCCLSASDPIPPPSHVILFFTTLIQSVNNMAEVSIVAVCFCPVCSRLAFYSFHIKIHLLHLRVHVKHQSEFYFFTRGRCSVANAVLETVVTAAVSPFNRPRHLIKRSKFSDEDATRM